jgi:hypothetical protein
LTGHECIVEFFDFSYSQMMHGGGGFELMILMEYCQGTAVCTACKGRDS